MTANISPIHNNNLKKGKRKGIHISIHPPWMFSTPCRVPLVRVLHLGRRVICSIRCTLELSSVFISSLCVRVYHSRRCGVALAAMFGGFGFG